MKKTQNTNNTLPLMHFVPQYFHNPTDRISVALVGAGGNGSQMLSALARINHALRSLGMKGISVTVYDPDTVEAPNVGRQLFTAGELGQNKAECLVTRFNRLFGTDWKAIPAKYDMKLANIVISCVDNVETRLDIGRTFRKWNITKGQVEKHNRQHGMAFNEYNAHYGFYWLDLGNGQRSGQAVLGCNRVPQPESSKYRTMEYLPTVTETFDFTKVKEEASGPSCSMAEALSKQDLFVNSVLVQTAGSLLWSLLTDAGLDTRGFFINLDSYRTSPMTLRDSDTELLPASLRPKKARSGKKTT